MFQALAIIGLLTALAAAGGHYLLFGLRAPRADKSGSPLIKRFSLWERLVIVVTFASLFALAVTGFLAACAGQRMSGYIIMLHMTFAPPFIVGVLAMVLTWAHECRFEPHDLTWAKGCGCLTCSHKLPAARFDLAQKAYLWLLAAATVVLSVTAALSMLPLAGTYWQELLYEIHRYTALVLTMATIIHLYCRTLARPGAWWVLLTGRVRLNWAKRYHSLWAQRFMPADIHKGE